MGDKESEGEVEKKRRRRMKRRSRVPAMRTMGTNYEVSLETTDGRRERGEL